MLRLSPLFSSHAVLQHSRDVAVWGWTEPGEQVSVSFRGTTVGAKAGVQGRFDIRIPSGSPGGPFELVATAGGETCGVTDILVGEVWVCSGQSNMGFQLRRSTGADEVIAGAACPTIRLLKIPMNAAGSPVEDVQAVWQTCTAETAAEFSAVAFYFGKRLHAELNIPVGLICSAVGGTGAEAWTRREDLLGNPDLAALAKPSVPHVDPGIAPEAARWMENSVDTTAWKDMICPTAWEHVGLIIDGAVWFRKEVHIPGGWTGKTLELAVGRVDDFDRTYFNGTLVGAIGPENPDAWNTPRCYPVPAGLVKAGRNVITVRVFDQWGCGGMRGQPEEMYLCRAEAGEDRIPLHGAWKWKVELALPPVAPEKVPSSALYNGMIHPLVPGAVAGVIWYQGETNVIRARQYHALFRALIRGWREAWGQPLPFLFTLLAGWHTPMIHQAESGIAELREAQLAALALDQTAVASAIDVGDVDDIHPPRKQEVGVRLALAALSTCYGRKIEGSGPVLKSFTRVADTARLEFDHAEGLHCRGDRVVGFVVAGVDGEYGGADGVIEGNAIVLTKPGLSMIKAVRYDWADHPVGNLYNAAGLPMLPFRTA